MLSQLKFDAMLAMGAIDVVEEENSYSARWNFPILKKYYPIEFEQVVRESITNPTQQVLYDHGMIAPVITPDNAIEFKTTQRGKRFQKLLTTVYPD